MHSALLVDDDPEIRAVIGHFFGRHRFEVKECSGVAEALDCLRDSRFDLIVTDYNLGDGHGGTVLEAAKRLCPTALCVLMSGNLGSVPEDVQAEATYVFEKPLHLHFLDVLMHSIETARLMELK